jgi:hypothetical protein
MMNCPVIADQRLKRGDGHLGYSTDINIRLP